MTSCLKEIKKDSKHYCEKLVLDCQRDIKIITFITSKGEIDIQLYGDTNPVTVSNFLKNVNQGIYNNKKFYKIINYPNTKIIHSGVKLDNASFITNNLLKFKSHITIPLEIAIKDSKEPLYRLQITNPMELKRIKHFFNKGSLAMVKVGLNQSSSTEFFFLLDKSREFNGRYALFGKVLKGFEILNKIDEKDKILKIISKS